MATIEDYKKAVLARYEEEKNGEFSEFLLKPTPAKLKNLCLLLLDGLNATDKNIFDIFFDSENTTRRFIEEFDNDRFRPLCSFITGRSNLSRVPGIDLVAVFVKLNSRPYNKFRNAKTVLEENKADHRASYDTEKHNTDESNVTIIQRETIPEPVSERNKKRVVLAVKPNKLQLGLFAIIIVLAIVAFSDMFKEKGCMMWNKDHYEQVDCDTKSVTSIYSSNVIDYDKETCQYLRKVTVSDTTIFFNPDKTPRIWYGKSANKEYEYFTYPGLHPETGKALKDITYHIIDNHIKNKNKLTHNP